MTEHWTQRDCDWQCHVRDLYDLFLDKSLSLFLFLFNLPNVDCPPNRCETRSNEKQRKCLRNEREREKKRNCDNFEISQRLYWKNLSFGAPTKFGTDSRRQNIALNRSKSYSPVWGLWIYQPQKFTLILMQFRNFKRMFFFSVSFSLGILVEQPSITICINSILFLFRLTSPKNFVFHT